MTLYRTTAPMADPRPFVLPAVVLGAGLGGFLDGIVLHQILQWHHMASAVQPPTDVAALEHNTFLDGLFHAAAWLVTLAGVFLLWRAADIARTRPPNGVLFGGLLVGWSLFNLIEGTLNHLVLGLHHVREGPDSTLYDAVFLIGSAIVFVIGSAILRRAARRTRLVPTDDRQLVDEPDRPPDRPHSRA